MFVFGGVTILHLGFAAWGVSAKSCGPSSQGEVGKRWKFLDLQDNVGAPHPVFLMGLHSGKSNIAIENGPFEDVSPIKYGDFPLLC